MKPRNLVMRRCLSVGFGLLFVTIASFGCRSDQEEEPPAREIEIVEEPLASDDAGDMAQSREVFGLPLPPEVLSIRREELRARVTTRMSLEDLEAFFAARLPEYEVLRPAGRLSVVPLRPHLPSIEAAHFSGARSHVVVDYRLPPDPARYAHLEVDLPSEDEEHEGNEDQQERPRRSWPAQGDRPVWLDSMRGEPVELRTEDGELLAPGARWGEPYTPPPGTPLNTQQNRHNFGRPFGDWRAH